MNDWLVELERRLRSGSAVVRVVVSRVQGSAPREAGATMLIDADGALDGSIGGGHLEWKAIAIARDLLAAPHAPGRRAARLDRFALGATLGQCCGGAVELWFERLDAADQPNLAAALHARTHDSGALLVSALHGPGLRLVARDDARALGVTDPAALPAARRLDGATGPLLLQPLQHGRRPLWLFGAGHVGRALVPLLAALPFDVRWIDSRASAFPADVPRGVVAQLHDDPAAASVDAPREALCLVMTHSHDLDFAICKTLLTRAEPAWLGLIGSRTKAARFAQRLLHQGATPTQLTRLCCPIGLPGIGSKLPAAIAVSVAAQVLEISERRATQPRLAVQGAGKSE